MSKPKVAFLLSGGCGGCDMSIVDLSDALVDVIPQLDIVFWAPTVADVKYKDLEAMPDKSIDVGLHSGCIRLDENEHTAKVMRAKCKVLIAYGVCASLGGIQGMANMHLKESLLETAYKYGPSTDNPDGILPQTKCLVDGKYELELPEFIPHIKTLDQVVDVDYYLGGCPPHYTHVAAAVTAILTGKLPAPGSWITNGKAVCDVCKRNPTSNGKERKLISSVKRTTNGSPSSDGCLLEEGYLCLGPISQGDCGGSCPKVNIPCRGCGGPIPGVKDYGMRAISAVAALFEKEELVDQVPSPTKLFNRYSLPGSILGRKIGGFRTCKKLK
ncbi:MAG TPA: F420-nonreducing hydrogenase [Dissulfurispiraceae bacterium]|nr:F420-nonreducing hydrogenase [Dissulfurispiraceae bacterium]